MKILFEVFEFWVCLEFFFKEVFDCFDIVVGSFLNFFHPISVFNTEIIENLIEPLVLSLDSFNGILVLRDYFLGKEELEPV